MDEKSFRPIAKEMLKKNGLTAFDIPTVKDKQTPDFEVHGDKDRYVIELKIKGDDPIEVKKFAEEFATGEIVARENPIGPRNTLDGIIRDGVKQMMVYDPNREMYRILWLHATGHDPELHFRRFQSTLFGTETLFSLRLSHIINCYFFHDSAFFRWREQLDGAIISFQNNGQLCINPLSPLSNKLRVSDISAGMARGIFDPAKSDGIADGTMIADCETDRSDIAATLQFLQTKYSVEHLQAMPMIQYSGTIAV